MRFAEPQSSLLKIPMPIIEPVNPDSPLSQGDILQGVRLFATKECWNADGGSAVIANQKLCLVLSRPCVALNKDRVTVASIDQITDGVPGSVKTLEDVLSFLKDVRDGADSPDVFYLGEINGKPGRFAARLDSIHSIQLPSDNEVRTAFLRERRVGRLGIDFARDLHVRLFRAFAALGFDDVKWFTDRDLKWIVEKARGELALAKQDLHEKQAAKSQREFSGQTIPDAPISTAQAKVTEIETLIVQFEEELKIRAK